MQANLPDLKDEAQACEWELPDAGFTEELVVGCMALHVTGRT